MQETMPEEAMLQYALDVLLNRRTIQSIPSTSMWACLESVAEIRFALSVTASWMYKTYIEEDNVKRLFVKRLCEAARVICDQHQHQWPR